MTITQQHSDQAPSPPSERSAVTTITAWPVSTTWRSIRATLPQAPQATGGSRPKAVRLLGLPRRNPRAPLSVTMKLRGGTEAWVELRARGATVRVPGHTAIAELVFLLNSHS